jgi:mannitol/fructose-specific phosphotransferase system IIA component (Ntr-type)
MTLAQFTEPKLLVPRLLSNRREGAITELSKRLETAARIESADSFVDAALNHVASASAVLDGVTFPLARGRAVKELSFAAGLSRQGIRWDVECSSVVHAVVLFAVPLSETRTYLSLVLTFSSFIKDEMAFTAFTHATQPEEMFTALKAVRLRVTVQLQTAEAAVQP